MKLSDLACRGLTTLNNSEQDPLTVLVTGAGGFIGGRVVEMAYLSGFAKVIAGLRRWDSAARVARFPVDMRLCDVLNPEQLTKNMKGVDAVVHCAYGDRQVTVEGTSNVLGAAYRLGVKRFVHISTVGVYGNVGGDVDETSPCTSMNDEYSDAKIEAEKLCWEYYAKGVPVLVLRPPIVYGPFSRNFTVGVAERICEGALGDMKNSADGLCNLLYVDDLVYCIFRSIRSDRSVGQVFNVNGPDKVTWNDYFREFAATLGVPKLKEINRAESRVRSTAHSLLLPVATFVGERYADAILRTGSKLGLEKSIGKFVSFFKTTPTNYDLRLYGRKAYFSYAKAASMLGYLPQYDMVSGLKLCVKWLAHEGFLQRFRVKNPQLPET